MCWLNNIQRNKLKRILTDKTSGSSEIVNKINVFFITNINQLGIIKESIPLLRNQLNHFAAVNTYIKQLEEIIKLNNHQILNDFLLSFDHSEKNKYQLIFNKLYKIARRINSIITISRSGTLKEVLKLWKNNNRNLKVILTESRPENEGKLFARELLKFGLKVELISDAMTALYVPKVDAALIGADEILKNGNAINKVGSKALSLLCKVNNKPFYVLTTQSKFSGRTKFSTKIVDPSRLWNYQSEGLTVSNIYFEEIEKKLITEIITD
jgi:translation initiation factor 2B subunit (eIF-2B alpha/beta/delta family)